MLHDSLCCPIWFQYELESVSSTVGSILPWQFRSRLCDGKIKMINTGVKLTLTWRKMWWICWNWMRILYIIEQTHTKQDISTDLPRSRPSKGRSAVPSWLQWSGSAAEQFPPPSTASSLSTRQHRLTANCRPQKLTRVASEPLYWMNSSVEKCKNNIRCQP